MHVRLIAKRQDTADVHSFIFHPEQDFSWQPGQYLHYIFRHANADDRGLERFFTIASAPFEKELMITTRITNDKGSSFKKALLAAAIGTELEIDEPEGKFVLGDENLPYVLIAGGIGITPYHSMLLEMDHDDKDLSIDLLYANNGPELVFADFFEVLSARRHNFHWQKFIDKRIEKADLQKFIDQPKTLFYLSGPRAMVETYQTLLKDSGVADERIKTDYFPGY